MSTDNSPAPHKHHALLKSSGIVACGVLASRVLGFVRDVIIARFLGTGFLAEAFFVAQRIPNLLRDMAGEGAAGGGGGDAGGKGDIADGGHGTASTPHGWRSGVALARIRPQPCHTSYS